MDCEIVVKIREDSDRAIVRKLQPVDIVKRAERARVHAATSTPSLPLAGHAFIAARQLASGDLSLRARSAAGAEVLRQHGKSWVHAFGKSAHVRVPTWGIIIDGMPARHVEKSEDFKEALIAENPEWGQPGHEVEIAHVGWLVQPRGYSGSLVVEFTNPIIANNAIRKGTIWQSCIHTNRSYCKEGRVKMCRKCQQYGHLQAQCPSRPFYCGFCAEEHPTWECPSKQGREITPKCANCKGPHKAGSGSCALRAQESARARQACLIYGREHRVPQYLQARTIPHSIDPTPTEAVTTAKKVPTAPKKVVKKAPAASKTTKIKQQSAQYAQSVEQPTQQSTQQPTRQSTQQSIQQPTQQPTLPAQSTQPAHPTAPEQGIAASIERPTTPPAAPQILSRTTVRKPTRAIPFNPNGAEKRPRGRPPKSKSSNDEELEPQEHVRTVLTASQQPTDTIDPALLGNNTSTAPKALRSRGPAQPVDMRVDPEQPLREQRRRERSRSQSYDNTALPPLPPINMHVENDNVVLNSTFSFQEIDSSELNSDARREILSQFTNYSRYNPRHSRIVEEDEDSAPISISTRSTPDALA